jgi:hypothetical protein
MLTGQLLLAFQLVFKVSFNDPFQVSKGVNEMYYYYGSC